MKESCPSCESNMFDPPTCTNCLYPKLSESQRTVVFALLLSDDSEVESVGEEDVRIKHIGPEERIVFLRSALSEFTSIENSSNDTWVSNTTSNLIDYVKSLSPIEETDFSSYKVATDFAYNLFGFYGLLVEMNGSIRVCFNPDEFSLSGTQLKSVLREFSPLELPLDDGTNRIFLGETKLFFNGQLSLPHFCIQSSDNWIYGFDPVRNPKTIQCETCNRTVVPWIHYKNSSSCEYSQVTLREVSAVAACLTVNGNVTRTNVGCSVQIPKETLTERVRTVILESPYQIKTTEDTIRVGPDGRLTWLLNWIVTEDPFSEGLNTADNEEIFISVPPEFIHNDTFKEFTREMIAPRVTSTGNKVIVNDVDHMTDKKQFGEILGLSDISICGPNSVSGVR